MSTANAGAPRSIRTMGGLLMGLLASQIIFLAARIVVTLGEISLLERVIQGASPSSSEFAALAVQDQLTSQLVVGTFLLAGIAWCVWQHRAQSNLHASWRRGLRFTPGWAVGWWFVPIASLWKPFQAVRELWAASDPEANEASWQWTRTWSVIGFWWAAWLVSLVIGGIPGAGPSPSMEASAEELVSQDWFWIGSQAVAIAASVLAIAIVRSVTARQTRLVSSRRHASVPPRADTFWLTVPAPPPLNSGEPR
jgi:hypothetical protein